MLSRAPQRREATAFSAACAPALCADLRYACVLLFAVFVFVRPFVRSINLIALCVSALIRCRYAAQPSPLCPSLSLPFPFPLNSTRQQRISSHAMPLPLAPLLAALLFAAILCIDSPAGFCRRCAFPLAFRSASLSLRSIDSPQLAADCLSVMCSVYCAVRSAFCAFRFDAFAFW